MEYPNGHTCGNIRRCGRTQRRSSECCKLKLGYAMRILNLFLRRCTAMPASCSLPGCHPAHGRIEQAEPLFVQFHKNDSSFIQYHDHCRRFCQFGVGFGDRV